MGKLTDIKGDDSTLLCNHNTKTFVTLTCTYEWMSLAASSFSSGLRRCLQYSKTSRFLYVLPVSTLRGLVIGDAKEVSWEEDFCTGVVRICAWEMAEVEKVVLAVIEAGVVVEETVETGLVALLLALVKAVVVTGLALVSVLVFTVLLTLFHAP